VDQNLIPGYETRIGQGE